MANTTMENNNRCPVEAAMRECPLMAELPQIPIEVFWGLHIAAEQSTQMKDTESPTEATATEDPAQESAQAVPPTPEADTPAEEQGPAGGVEMDRAAEALNWLRMGQIVGIIVMGGAETDEDESAPEEVPAETPVEEPTAAPAEVTIAEQEPADHEVCQYHNPNPGIIDFKSKAIERLNEIMDQLVDETDSDKQEQLLEEVADIAVANQLPTLAEVAENCERRTHTVTDVIGAISIALEALAAAERRKRLLNAFEEFCEKNHTTPEEMLAILGG